jgi:hypothetical protein
MARSPLSALLYVFEKLTIQQTHSLHKFYDFIPLKNKLECLSPASNLMLMYLSIEPDCLSIVSNYCINLWYLHSTKLECFICE